MKTKLAPCTAMVLLVCSLPAWAHRIDEYLQATILSLGANQVHASMRLIPGVLVAPSVIATIDANRDGSFSEDEKRAYADQVIGDLSLSIDGRAMKPQLDSWDIPDASHLRDGLGEIHLEYHVDLPPDSTVDRALVLINRHRNGSSVYLVNVEVPQDRTLHVVDQKRDPQQSVYELDYQQTGAADGSFSRWSRTQAWWKGLQLSSLFHLGLRHIAEGTDHLLFLLVLLLPAPLLAVGPRWGAPATVRRSLLHILGIVTAFTIGHSLTLTLAAMNFVHVPSRPVEVLIAVSILVSAVYALRPIFPGKEAWIAAFFGLIHGLAFASTLDRLGMSRWDRVAGILSFNLGIETMQLLVVALVLPSLLVMSRTTAYSGFRIAGAAFACIASAMWIAERLFRVQTHVDTVVNLIAQRGLVCSGILFAASGIALLLFAKRSEEGVKS
ncbi:putative membrane protein (plasmid) [Acidisarcina polymorpha]|uniref:Putative membrane protein n=1 Tax=Acidisarcina polymorpha TaxID=2211140 RepID=A0A2Z5GAI5_9BACT|nr:HupE/UreJ family protein [Acidisarcina polymorpha]AXC16213.1 putative membrane protein [Acidisarcina polymorpha]